MHNFNKLRCIFIIFATDYPDDVTMSALLMHAIIISHGSTTQCYPSTTAVALHCTTPLRCVVHAAVRLRSKVKRFNGRIRQFAGLEQYNKIG